MISQEVDYFKEGRCKWCTKARYVSSLYKPTKQLAVHALGSVWTCRNLNRAYLYSLPVKSCNKHNKETVVALSSSPGAKVYQINLLAGVTLFKTQVIIVLTGILEAVSLSLVKK